RDSFTLDDLHENAFYRANRTLKSENISFKNVNYLSRKGFYDKTKCIRSPNSSKCNSVSGKRKDQIYVQNDETREGCNNLKNLFMIVEMIANNLDYKRVAEFFDRYIESRNSTTYKCYLKDIKAYGFDYIILIGDYYTGFLFLDCYGRVFEWKDLISVL
ncbi:3150_t:CDS:2, partial [Funneliformis caledonium]